MTAKTQIATPMSALDIQERMYGTLKTGSSGKKVKSRHEAIAIGLRALQADRNDPLGLTQAASLCS
jgi:hypothetical protein